MRTLFDKSALPIWTHAVRPEGEPPKMANQSRPLRRFPLQSINHASCMYAQITWIHKLMIRLPDLLNYFS